MSAPGDGDQTKPVGPPAPADRSDLLAMGEWVADCLDVHDHLVWRTVVRRLVEEVEALRYVLVFADGFVATSGDGTMVLADLYALDAPTQQVLTAAGCWPRGSMKKGRGDSDA